MSARFWKAATMLLVGAAFCVPFAYMLEVSLQAEGRGLSASAAARPTTGSA
jgi:hypothetical protein